MELGQPGYAYPNLNIWDIGLDNVDLSTSPLPAPASLLVLAASAPALARRTRSCRGA
jgi:hypothetical protein